MSRSRPPARQPGATQRHSQQGAESVARFPSPRSSTRGAGARSPRRTNLNTERTGGQSKCRMRGEGGQTIESERRPGSLGGNGPMWENGSKKRPQGGDEPGFSIVSS